MRLKYLNSIILILAIAVIILISGCAMQDTQPPDPEETYEEKADFPKIASWLAKKDEITANKNPYDLVMTAWFTPEEAEQIKSTNPKAKILAGLSVNWVWNNQEWMTFLMTVANHGKAEPIEMTEEMYLHKPNGERCAFGWASKEWGHEEIYAMDPRNAEWTELITNFYKNVLEQTQHDGIIIDMVVEKQWWCPEAISDAEWLEATKNIFSKIKRLNSKNKLVVFNAGRNISDIDEFDTYFDAYLMENFMGNQMKTTFDDGLKAADSKYLVIYGVDTDDTGQKDLKKMRLGLTLSMLNDNTYFTYDFGPRDHGQAWWFPEYNVDLGRPLGGYYKKENAYWRNFEKGIVVSSPYSDITFSSDETYKDATTGINSGSFTIEKGDGRIFIKE
ncbi:MAG: putative glycoside hydrolase family 15 protein [Nanoarchaeota archaeon]|nr:putative glycoside hydrolase family 15 protein [Nanoarchaeota archaeon]